MYNLHRILFFSLFLATTFFMTLCTVTTYSTCVHNALTNLHIQKLYNSPVSVCLRYIFLHIVAPVSLFCILRVFDQVYVAWGVISYADSHTMQIMPCRTYICMCPFDPDTDKDTHTIDNINIKSKACTDPHPIIYLLITPLMIEAGVWQVGYKWLADLG